MLQHEITEARVDVPNLTLPRLDGGPLLTPVANETAGCLRGKRGNEMRP